MLKIEHITASYHKGNPILKDVSMEVGSGERVVILGRNGAGKTTFANSIFGLVPMLSGGISYNGKDLSRLSADRIKACGIAYFMQGAPVFQQMTVRENLLFAAGNMKAREFNSRLEDLRKTLSLLKDPAIDRTPAGSLSGGERTQLAVGMSIINQPSLLILDEPFAGLSPANAKLVLQILEDYARKSTVSIIMIAQDRHLASAFSASQFLIRDGKIIRE